jgi:UDP-N-acetyl-D-glucosamine dehydrogenase
MVSDPGQTRKKLLSKIKSLKARLGVIGIGYVGLPLAVEFAKAGFEVVGIDADPQRVAAVNAGSSYIGDVDEGELFSLVSAGRLSAVQDYKVISDLDAVSICVPTPLRKSKEPDISYVMEAVSQLKIYLRKGQLVVLESTTYPGTTEELVLPAISRTGLEVGRDFFLAYSPERVDPGNPKFKTPNTPKVVGGLTRQCTDAATCLYMKIIEQVVPVSSPRTAEMVKLLESTFRAVNIALVNEIAIICDKLAIDTWEVIAAAATKPFGFMPFYPGPGLGGHCIPVDPQYLSWKLRSLNYHARFIELAEYINSRMPGYVVDKISDVLNIQRKCLNGSRILVLGAAYKRDVTDWRESPSLDIIRLLKSKGALVNYHDPLVPVINVDGERETSCELTTQSLREADCVVIVADHSLFDWKWIVEESALVMDTRNATQGLDSPKVVKL